MLGTLYDCEECGSTGIEPFDETNPIYQKDSGIRQAVTEFRESLLKPTES